MSLLALVNMLEPVRKSKAFFICTILKPALVNLTTNTKTILNTVLGTSKILTSTSAPNALWLLCLMYVAYMLNIAANSSIGDIAPHKHLHGQTPDITLHFVSDSMSQSTTLIPILFLSMLRKRGDGL